MGIFFNNVKNRTAFYYVHFLDVWFGWTKRKTIGHNDIATKESQSDLCAKKFQCWKLNFICFYVSQNGGFICHIAKHTRLSKNWIGIDRFRFIRCSAIFQSQISDSNISLRLIRIYNRVTRRESSKIDRCCRCSSA